MKFAFLACETTLPDMPMRRVDAFEFDLQFGGLRNALETRGHTLVALDWKNEIEAFKPFDAVVVGTPWNYQDFQSQFLDTLKAIEGLGVRLYNTAELIHWNINKSYLKDLAKLGAKTVPTRWVEKPTKHDVRAVFEEYDTSHIVLKRQVGAGSFGQKLFQRDETLPEGVLLDRPAMIQPFLPAIQTEGEYSFIFIDGAFSHALLKQPKSGDYRIQSSYGGTEKIVSPTQADIDVAQKNLSLIPYGMPLYARVDLLRGYEGELLLMELEMIEPYLYIKEGPHVSELYAEALIKRADS
ncbi:ATP-grasp domain-containing protein [Hirschia litorea]|uniref:RimK family alpha-L-glutamate ligase n=1 Tax=Hirschia litorea TaxID=1199156 RepID=A0ABW2IMJ9_9PROT